MECKRWVALGLALVLAGAVLPVAPPAAAADKISSSERGRARAMLRNIKKELEKNYYDPGFHGVDLGARFLAAEQKIEAASSLGQLMGIVAQAVIDLDDSHTWFMPPDRTISVDYGWRIQMIGDRCVVMAVKKGSDAEAQGLKVGDVVLEAQGVQPTRENLWKFRYLYQTLRPQPGLAVLAQSPGQAPRTVKFAAKVHQEKRVLDFTEGDDFWDEVRQAENRPARVHSLHAAGDVAVWRMPGFNLENGQVDDIMGRARKHKALVIDLRDNGGGSVDTLSHVVSWLFGREVKIADLKGRKPMKPYLAKARKESFTGPVVALVDSGSGSASEVLARVLQLEKRGQVVGDRTAGAVMRSRFYSYDMGIDRVIFYGMSITNADLVMADGKSLERLGVSPDVALLPTPEDLAAGRDPALARAVTLAGGTLDPVAAGKLLPPEED
jgi:C-terminal processing protease CtpA/Prc